MNYVRSNDPSHREALKHLAASLPATGDLRLVGMDVSLPTAVAEMLREIVTKLAAGEPVAVVTANADMTPNEVATFLGVSRGYVTKLLDAGMLPFHEVGSHRRIPSAAVAAYKAVQQAKSRAAMDELVRVSEELGLYDDPSPPPSKSVFRGTDGTSR